MTVTVCVYLLFLYDQRYKGGTWELLDDSVYYVKVRVGHRRFTGGHQACSSNCNFCKVECVRAHFLFL